MKNKFDLNNEQEDKRYQERDKFFSDQIVNNSRSMISIINRDYIYEKVNPAFCNAHKRSPESIIGKTLEDVWGHEVFSNKIKSSIDLCFSGKTIRYEASFNTPESGNKYFEVVFRPVETVGSKITHLLAETFDISEMKRSELTAVELQKDLKEMETNYQNRLFQVQTLETIGVLAGGIAHDFNNILATISGYAEMLKDNLSKDQDSSDKAGKILIAVNRARSLTNQILTFSKEADQEKVSVNVSEILRETVEFIKSAIPSNIYVDEEIPDINVEVFTDPAQLFRVFVNLMTNGIQAMEESGGTLSVNLTVVDGQRVKHEIDKEIVANEYVLLTFRDTGKGIEPSQINRIFEPFYTTREVGKGTGLGLSVVYGIVTELDGEVLVSSKKREGSIFRVYLPLIERKISNLED